MWAREVPIGRSYQCAGGALRALNEEPELSRYSEKPFQNSSCSSLVSESSVGSPSAVLVSSLGSQTTLNFGATGELPMRHSSISRAQKLTFVCSLSQSITLRYSSVTCLATHTTVLAPRPAAYTSSWPKCLWS